MVHVDTQRHGHGARMKVRVLFFGASHDITGREEEHLEIDDGQALGDLRRRYESRFPKLAEMGGSLLVAVNQEVRAGSWPLADGDEVAFLPPVSGGHDGQPAQPGVAVLPGAGGTVAGGTATPGCAETTAAPKVDSQAPSDFFRLTRDPIPTGQLADGLKASADGAVVVFEGIVRDHLGNRRTLYLEYEAYEPMAVAKMQEIGHEAHERFGIDRIGIIHRLGRINMSETSVAIMVTSEHRGAAFEACRHAIDRLKQIVPIWKKEYFEDGAIWAEGESHP
jgi:MoaE-MoaD fusion protein